MSISIRSTIPGLRWPGLPGQDGARLLAMLHQLDRSQWWPPAQLAVHQFRQLETIVAHCSQHMPFWRDRLRAAGIRPGQKLTADIWRRLPILSRREARDVNAQLLCSAIPPGHGRVAEAATTGSTGVPLEYARTELSMLYWRAFNLRSGLWHHMDTRGKIALIRYGKTAPGGDRSPDWGEGWIDAFHTGQMVRLDATYSLAEQADWLLAENPDYLLVRPSSAMLLAEHFRQTGQRIPNLRAVQTIGEVVSPALRQMCHDVFGVAVVDVYSAEEAGFLALQCPQHNHYHVVSENVLMELLDDDDRPVAPGEVGRVVVSTLNNFVMPLLRYELGDHAELGQPCPCGRGLPVLNHIVGRTRDRITMPDGTHRFAYYGTPHIHEIAPIVQHQMVQVAPTRMEYHLVVRRPLTAEERATMTGWLHDAMGYPFELSFVYVDEIPRGPGGKYQDFRSEIDPP